MSEPDYTLTDRDGDKLEIRNVNTSVYVCNRDAKTGEYVTVVVRPDERQAAAQAVAGPDWRVVPPRESDDGWIAVQLDEYERLQQQAAGEYGPADIARAKSDALHAFADTMDRLPDDWILVRRDYGSEVTVEDLLRQTADRYVEQPYPILTQIRVDPKQPDRPEPVDPASGADLIAAERARQINNEGYVAEHDDRHGDGQLLQAAATYVLEDFAMWPWSGPPKFTSNNRVRELVKAGALIAAEIDRLHRAEPEPDEAAVEALERAFSSVGIYLSRETKRKLIRDHGVQVEVSE